MRRAFTMFSLFSFAGTIIPNDGSNQSELVGTVSSKCSIWRSSVCTASCAITPVQCTGRDRLRSDIAQRRTTVSNSGSMTLPALLMYGFALMMSRRRRERVSEVSLTAT
ncbi:hypothetical protein BKA62DRAFT_723383, partial [Auriculariales sp. MPI-PUGE-AT-0066]